jgi:hypothetical protein
LTTSTIVPIWLIPSAASWAACLLARQLGRMRDLGDRAGALFEGASRLLQRGKLEVRPVGHLADRGAGLGRGHRDAADVFGHPLGQGLRRDRLFLKNAEGARHVADLVAPVARRHLDRLVAGGERAHRRGQPLDRPGNVTDDEEHRQDGEANADRSQGDHRHQL